MGLSCEEDILGDEVCGDEPRDLTEVHARNHFLKQLLQQRGGGITSEKERRILNIQRFDYIDRCRIGGVAVGFGGLECDSINCNPKLRQVASCRSPFLG